MESTEKQVEHSFAKVFHERVQAMRSIPPVLGIVWAAAPVVVAWSVVLRVAIALLPLALLFVSRLIINGVVAVVERHEPLGLRFWWLVGAEFGLAILIAVLARVLSYLDAVLADRYTHHISVRVIEHASQLDLTLYEDPVFYDRLERARVQATDRLVMIQAIGNLIQQMVTTIALSLAILWLAPWLLLLLLAGVIPGFLGETHFAFLGYAKNFRQTPLNRQLDYLRLLGGSKEAAKELKLFGLHKFLTDRFTKISSTIRAENLALSIRRLRAGAALSIISTLGYYAAYAWTIWKTLQGGFDIGTLAFLTGAILQASGALQQVFSTLSGIADQALFLTDLLAFFDMQPTVKSKPNALPVPVPILKGFEFRNVSFSYPGSSRKVLADFNLFLARGQRIALIGENGQGKTTIVKLLTRLYDPTEGQILLDGIDLREYSMEQLHHETGVIFQDFMRYEMTVRENIGIGRIEQMDQDEDIERAAEKSLANDVVKRLGDGYEQMLGRRFASGVDLSGGEWQKLALARAYLRDAQLLILDEPTAALDARSEAEVFERFAELTRGKMAVLISHRFSTVRMVDRIVVLEGGRLVEEGTHDELLELGGRYATMFELQAASYR
jgi:ATP-binding cassette, subfamily B, bacterial